MNIILLGYGKMGKEIEKILKERNHNIPHIIDKDNQDEKNQMDTATIDAAIEFSQPEAAIDNIKFCIDHKIPVAIGTTGWLDQKAEIEKYCEEKDGTMLYASNFSIGVNIFFKLNQFLARMMAQQPQYNPAIDETHHTEKKDAPSGTAITLAEGILNHLERKNNWVKGEETNQPGSNELLVRSFREHDVKGTHVVKYQSDIDDIEIKHQAHSRRGFALGAVLVAEWLKDQKGVVSMDDYLPF